MINCQQTERKADPFRTCTKYGEMHNGQSSKTPALKLRKGRVLSVHLEGNTVDTGNSCNPLERLKSFGISSLDQSNIYPKYLYLKFI